MSNSPVSEAQFHKHTFPAPIRPSYTLDENGLAACCPLDNGHFPKTAQYNLGMLDTLPLELLQFTLAHVDLATLTGFRRVNQRARDVVDSIHEYGIIIIHAPNVLRALIATETASYTTCKKLYDKLCSPQCDNCSEFGAHLYVLTCKRLCFECRGIAHHYNPAWESSAQALYDKFRLTQEDVAGIPRMRTVPGFYSVPSLTEFSRSRLLDFTSIRDAVIRRHGTEAADRLVCPECTTPRSFPKYKTVNLAVIRIPAFDPVSKEVDWGSLCLVCHYGGISPMTLLLKKNFHLHLNRFGHITKWFYHSDFTQIMLHFNMFERKYLEHPFLCSESTRPPSADSLTYNS